jgi:hypothetical protein
MSIVESLSLAKQGGAVKKARYCVLFSRITYVNAREQQTKKQHRLWLSQRHPERLEINNVRVTILKRFPNPSGQESTQAKSLKPRDGFAPAPILDHAINANDGLGPPARFRSSLHVPLHEG